MQKNKYYIDYTEKISKDLHEEFTNYNECEFACDCAFKLGHGMNPTSTYTYALKSFVANGGNVQRASEIFSYVDKKMKVLTIN